MCLECRYFKTLISILFINLISVLYQSYITFISPCYPLIQPNLLYLLFPLLSLTHSVTIPLSLPLGTLQLAKVTDPHPSLSIKRNVPTTGRAPVKDINSEDNDNNRLDTHITIDNAFENQLSIIGKEIIKNKNEFYLTQLAIKIISNLYLQERVKGRDMAKIMIGLSR
jgi:hypothetical protein